MHGVEDSVSADNVHLEHACRLLVVPLGSARTGGEATSQDKSNDCMLSQVTSKT